MRGLGTAGLVGLTGCTSVIGRDGSASGTVVQLAADSEAKEVQSDINSALHDAGLPGDVSVEILPTSSDRAQQQFSQWLSAGLERPSLFRMDGGWTIPFILRDQIANLSEALPEVANAVTENYFEASVATATGPGGDVYGVPLFSDFGLMLYRKDLVEQAGFDPSGWATNPIGWKRFARVVDETKRQTDTAYGFTFQAAQYEGLPCCTFNEWMASWGGSYFGARKNLLRNVGERPVTVDADPVVRSLGMGRTFIQGSAEGQGGDFPGPIAPEAVLQWEEDSSLSAFTDGDAVAHRNWPYSILEAGAGEAFGENLGVMPMPFGVRPDAAKFEGMGGSVSALGGWHITLNPNARHRQAALEVLRAMQADSFYLTLTETLGYVPPKPALLDSERTRNVDVIGRYVDTLKFAGERAVPRPVTVVWPQQSPRIAQKVGGALAGDESPNAALSELKSLLVEIENNAREARS